MESKPVKNVWFSATGKPSPSNQLDCRVPDFVRSTITVGRRALPPAGQLKKED